MSVAAYSSVKVITTARLHMGFIDMHGGLGRRFGSIGLSLDKPATRLQVAASDDFSVSGPTTEHTAERVAACARRFAQLVGLTGCAHFKMLEAIPEHSGLGSGTQMSLAVGVALSKLYGLGLTAREVAALASRGARSGIGVGAFEHGGLLVDGGRGPHTQVPPLIARMDFPEAWRIILVSDMGGLGVHGAQELQAFGALPEFPAAQAAHLSRLVLMQALPAVAEQDLESFGVAISELQRTVGDHFAAEQGGGCYISPAVADAMAWLEAQGVSCVGQSSWGPTGFAVVASEEQAAKLLQGLEQRGMPLRYEICSAHNTGSIVEAI